MKLLITPALKLTEEQKTILEKTEVLFFVDDEKSQLCSELIGCDTSEVEGIVCNFFFLHHSLDELPGLRYIQLTSVGYDRIPYEEARSRGIAIFNAGDAYAIPMAEWSICKTLEIYKRSSFFYRNQVLHRWEKNRSIQELAGKNALIIGFGNVGKNIAKRLRAFDVIVRIISNHPIIEDCIYEIGTPDSMASFIKESDIVYITVPLTEATYHLVDGVFLSEIKDNAVIVNVSRGTIIDENALVDSLKSGKISAVALDVFEEEPLTKTSPLWEMNNVIVSPHNSFVGNNNNSRLFNIIMDNLKCFYANQG